MMERLYLYYRNAMIIASYYATIIIKNLKTIYKRKVVLISMYNYREYQKNYDLSLKYKNNNELCKKYLTKAKKALNDGIFDRNIVIASISSYRIIKINEMLKEIANKQLNNYYIDNKKVRDLNNYIKSNYANTQVFINKNKYVIIFNSFVCEYNKSLTFVISYIDNKYVELSISFDEFMKNDETNRLMYEFVKYHNDKSYSIYSFTSYEGNRDSILIFFRKIYDTNDLIAEFSNFVNILNSSELISFYKCLNSIDN